MTPEAHARPLAIRARALLALVSCSAEPQRPCALGRPWRGERATATIQGAQSWFAWEIRTQTLSSAARGTGLRTARPNAWRASLPATASSTAGRLRHHDRPIVGSGRRPLTTVSRQRVADRRADVLSYSLTSNNYQCTVTVVPPINLGRCVHVDSHHILWSHCDHRHGRGYCDERGTPEYNLAFGDRPAEVVKNYLANLGVASNWMVTRSFGREAPFCRDSEESCWSQNRRGHFVITRSEGNRMMA